MLRIGALRRATAAVGAFFSSPFSARAPIAIWAGANIFLF